MKDNLKETMKLTSGEGVGVFYWTQKMHKHFLSKFGQMIYVAIACLPSGRLP